MWPLIIRVFKIIIGLVVIFSLVVFLHYIHLLPPVERFFLTILKPVQVRLYRAGVAINDYYETYLVRRDLNQLIQENQEFKQKNDQLIVVNSQLRVLLEEQKIINSEKNFLSDRGYKFLLARVLGKSDNLNTIIIDKGRNEGLVEDLPVIVNEGILIGKIIKVTESSSIVLFLTDNNSKVAATIQNNDATIGLIEGQHGLGITMDFVPVDEVVKPGEVIITSGLEPMIPRGLVVGSVDHSQNDSNGVFQQVFLRPLVDYNKAVIVSVLVPMER